MTHSFLGLFWCDRFYGLSASRPNARFYAMTADRQDQGCGGPWTVDQELIPKPSNASLKLYLRAGRRQPPSGRGRRRKRTEALTATLPKIRFIFMSGYIAGITNESVIIIRAVISRAM